MLCTPRNIIFLHIPKTGGGTLAPVIQRQFSDHEVQTIDVTPSVEQSIREFRELPQEERGKIRCVTGHASFGLHKDLLGDTEYVTLVRDPVERIISNYYYIRRTPGHRSYDSVVGQEMSLREFVESGVNAQVENGMTRSISGDSYTQPDRTTLKQAKSNLREHFGVVGITERFDESLVVMKRRYGWKRVGYVKRNVTRSRPTKEDIEDETHHLIESKNQLDLELYEYGVSLFEEKLEMVDDLEEELSLLRFECWLRDIKKKARQAVGRMYRTVVPGS